MKITIKKGSSKSINYIKVSQETLDESMKKYFESKGVNVSQKKSVITLKMHDDIYQTVNLHSFNEFKKIQLAESITKRFKDYYCPQKFKHAPSVLARTFTGHLGRSHCKEAKQLTKAIQGKNLTNVFTELNNAKQALVASTYNPRGSYVRRLNTSMTEILELHQATRPRFGRQRSNSGIVRKEAPKGNGVR